MLASANETTVFFSVARLDRFGAFVHDMLMAHQYAFEHNATYGGACPLKNSPQFARNADLHNQRLNLHQELIQALGLSHILKVACPQQHIADGQQRRQVQAKILSRKDYYNIPSKLYNEQWLQYLHKRLLLPTTTHQTSRHDDDDDDDLLNVACHVRRGDVTPCANADRYFPNLYYLQVLERHIMGKNQYLTRINVTIFSESSSFESLDVFRRGKKNTNDFTLALDTNIATIWRAIMQANIVVLSKSTFSMVPAMLNPTATVFYPNMSSASSGSMVVAPHWTKVDDDIVENAAREFQRLRAECGS